VDEAVGKYSTPLLFEGEAANSSLSIVKRREEHPYSFSIDSHRAFEVARAILLFFFICSNIPWIVLVIWSLCGGFGKRKEEKSLTNQHFANARSPRLRGNWQLSSDLFKKAVTRLRTALHLRKLTQERTKKEV
jgi:hypothetical protein